ncbi:MAG: asparagine synthase-related protein [Sulfolobales archaeon]
MLADLVSKEIESRVCDCIIMSGGIDTSYIATIARKIVKIPLKGIVVGLEGSVTKDLYWGSLVARELGIEIHQKIFSVSEALRATDEVIRIMDTFDPIEVRNDVSVYIALEYAAKLGCRCVYTGDAGDELFAGYSYMHLYRLEDLSRYIEDLSSYMEFSSSRLGEELGVEVIQPLASRSVVELALKIPPECKISYLRVARGKEILRLLLEDLSIPSHYRLKEPIEVGSGSVTLSNIWASMVTEDLIESMSKILKPRSRDQAYLLSRYLRIFGGLRKAEARDTCRICGGRVKRGYCKRCGYYEKSSM